MQHHAIDDARRSQLVVKGDHGGAVLAQHVGRRALVEAPVLLGQHLAARRLGALHQHVAQLSRPGTSGGGGAGADLAEQVGPPGHRLTQLDLSAARAVAVQQVEPPLHQQTRLQRGEVTACAGVAQHRAQQAGP